MTSLGYNYTALQLKNKWHYEMSNFEKIKTKNRKSGGELLDYKYDTEMSATLNDDETVQLKFMQTS
jgi:hypothetical protein